MIQQSGCRYESEVKAYLQKEDVVGCEADGTTAKATCKRKPQQKRSNPRLVDRDASRCVSKTNLDKKNQAEPPSLTLLKDRVSSESNCVATKEGLSVFQCNYDNRANNDNAMQTEVTEHSETKLSRKDEQPHSSPELETNPDTSLEPVEEMFYLPKWDVFQKLHSFSESTGSLEMILSNVKHLLSRSPPECLDLHCSLNLNEPAHFDEADELCSSLREEVDHFQVNFDLDEHENSFDSDCVDCSRAGAPPESVKLPSETVSAAPDSAANSPSWDEVFDDVVDDGADKNTNLPLESKVQLTSLDDSVDLFDDDEAFQLVSLPTTETPNKDTIIPINTQDTDQRKEVTQNVKDASNNFNAEESSILLESKPPSEQRSEAFDYSQGIFSVNFDLGLSFDSEEEKTVEPASDTTKEPTADREQTLTSLTLNKPNTSSNRFTLGQMSTPRVSPMSKKLPCVIAKSNLSPIITERESLVRPNASTPTLAFVSPKSRNLELCPKVLSSQTQPRGLCRRSLLDGRNPVYEARACSGEFKVCKIRYVTAVNEIYRQRFLFVYMVELGNDGTRVED